MRLFCLSRPAVRVVAGALAATAPLATMWVADGPVAAAQATAVMPAAQQTWMDDQESPTHSYTQAEAVAQAKRFSLISALPNTYAPYVSAMKAANPNLKLFVYMNGTMANGGEVKSAPEAWFLHDRYGHRLQNQWHLFLMDIANPAWTTNRIGQCAALVAQSHYDGCFLDNLGSGTFGTGMLSGTPIDPATGLAYTAGAWLPRAAKLADAVRVGTGKPVFGNGLVNGQAYFAGGAASSSTLFNGSQIACAETFVRTARMAINEYRSLTAWKQDVDMLAAAASQGRRVAALTKVWASGTTQQIYRWHTFAVGSFLLGADGNQFFEFSSSPKAALSAGDSILPNLTRLGSPSGGYTAMNGIYARAFTGGMVLVNPTSQPVVVPLTRTYTGALTGQTETGSITVDPHGARFLLG